jgi:hypothetical protein
MNKQTIHGAAYGSEQAERVDRGHARIMCCLELPNASRSLCGGVVVLEIYLFFEESEEGQESRIIWGYFSLHKSETCVSS